MILGLALTIPLFKFDLSKFLRSSLFVKILFWIPIFVVFLGVLYASNPLRSLILIGLFLASFIEVVRITEKAKDKLTPAVYFLFLTIGLVHFSLLNIRFADEFIRLLITISFASVLSDVTAFFFGNYLGKNKLPRALNPNKSWEGVAGQIIGAGIGVLLVNIFVQSVVHLWIFIPIGVGAATGDLANSYVKRKLGIKDWSNNIPGHGGFVDRLSSLVGSVVATFYFLLVV
ncbi:phosphatidate cytidylyltransferase [Candidatus Saccharibacteria bacterium]|nr:phosphatidate cytidylyltransferase [Candidatus Saccharibacteria bacterium]MBI3337906.1 phosphatidate cytidylyltransferase [Candidatus Saccharibacteria bacterium]